MIDRVAASLGRRLVEVPVGFKWFVDGLVSGEMGFGGEESAGASFLRFDGSVWSTDKDGMILALLAAEMTAVTGVEPGLRYRQLTEQFGAPVYARIDAPADAAQKAVLGKMLGYGFGFVLIDLTSKSVNTDGWHGVSFLAKYRYLILARFWNKVNK